MNEESSIVNYFDSTCRIIIDEFNFLFKDMNFQEKQNYANNKFCEADFVFRLGRPFGSLARYTLQGCKGRDIIVDYKGFEVEVKYWRNWSSGTGVNKLKWQPSFYDAITWLCDEIDKGKKEKRAFIAGWSTIFKWSELLQLGCSTGKNPKVNLERLHMLPFLNCSDDTISTINTKYDLKQSTYRILKKDSIINWKLLGNSNDNFNIVIFW